MAYLMVFSSALGPGVAFAQNSTPTVDPCTVTDDSSALEQCNEHKLALDTAYIQIGETTIWTAAAIACTVACAQQTNPYTAFTTAPASTQACIILQYAAMAVDVAGGIATVALGAAIKKTVDAGELAGMLPGLAMDAMSMTQMTTSVGAGAAGTAGGAAGTAGGAAGGAADGAGSAGNTAGQTGSKLNCPMLAIMGWINALMRGANMAISFVMAHNAAQYAAQQRVQGSAGGANAMGTGADANGGGNSQGPNGGPMSGNMPKMLEGSSASTAQKFSPSNIASSAATAAGEYGPKAEQAMQNQFGQGLANIANGLLNGQDPLAIGASMAGDQAGSYSKLMDQMESNKDGIVDAINKNVPPGTKGAIAFESVKSSGGGSVGSSGPGMPNVADIMAQLMPKKPGAPEPKGPDQNVNLGVKEDTKDQLKTGFHAPQASLFEIVGARYQFLANKFLAGEDLPADRDPANDPTLVPKNIYLKH